MALQVIIANTDVTQYVRAGSVRIVRAADGYVGTAEFELVEPVGLLDGPKVDYAITDSSQLVGLLLPSVVETFAPVEIRDNGQPVFKGKAAQITKTVVQSRVTISVACQDVIADLSKILIYQYSVNNTTAGAIVAWVIAQCSGVLANDASYVSDSTSISAYAVTGKSALEVLRDLAGQVQATWYVDLSGRLHWRLRAGPENSGKTYGLVTGDGILAGSLSVDIDGAGLANHVTVLAQKGSTTQSTATQTPAAGSDDGMVASAVSSSWPPTTGQSADTSMAVLQPGVQRNTPTSSLSGGPALYGYPYGYAGASWPPPLTQTYYNSIIKTHSSGYYIVSNSYMRFDFPLSIPANAQIISAQLIFQLHVNYEEADSVSQLYIERSSAAQYAQPTIDPTPGSYITEPPTPGGHTVLLPPGWVSPGASLFLRVGWEGGPPGARNMCDLSSISLLVYYSLNTQYYSTRAWIRFPSPNLADANIVSAKLRMFAQSVSGQPAFRVRKSNVTFPISANTYQQESGQEIAQIYSVAPYEWMEIQLPVNVVDKANPNTFCLDPNMASPPASSWQVDISSADDSPGWRPELVLEYIQITPTIEATAQDAASIAQYGERRMMIFDPRLSQAECEALAAKEVALRAWPAQSIRLSTLAGTGVSPGQLVTVVFDEIGLAGSYVAQAVSATYAAAGIVQYEMTLDRFRPDLIRYLSA